MQQYTITISREFGSGGRLIGKRLAEKLSIPCYDRTIINRTAEKSGLSSSFLEKAEERARSKFHLRSAPVGIIGSSGFTNHTVPVSHQAFFVQSEVIRELADEGPCVIVGRCSDYILGDRPECLKVFVYADLETRVRRCIKYYNLPEEGLEEHIKQTDRGRANYYNYYTGHNWGDMRMHDLSINTAAAGIDGAVDLIAELVRLRAQRAEEGK